MPTPTTQQIKQEQQESPQWQAQQLLRQKWANMFNNINLCQQYVGKVALKAETNVIPIPDDPNERGIAMEAAQAVMSNTPEEDIRSKAARLFLRACASYVKRYNKQETKAVNNLAKQGFGGVSQSDVTPKSESTLDLKQAGMAAGKNMAYLDKSNDTKGQQTLEQQISQYLNNRVYSTYYLVYYLTTVAGEDPEKVETWCKKIGYQNQTDETTRRTSLRDVATQYLNYENSLGPRGEPNKNTVNQQDWINQNTTTLTGGRTNGAQ